MLILMCLITVNSLDIYSEREAVVKDNLLNEAWGKGIESSFQCNPGTTIYESSGTSARTFKVFNSGFSSLLIKARTNDQSLDVKVHPSYIELSPDYVVTFNVEYMCVKDGTSEVHLKLIHSDQTINIKYMKICGTPSFFDWSTAVLILLSTAFVTISAFFANSERICGRNNGQIDNYRSDLDRMLNKCYALLFAFISICLVFSLFYLLPYATFYVEIIIFLCASATLTYLFNDLTLFIKSTHQIRVPLAGQLKTLLLVLYGFSILLIFLYFFTKNWLINDILVLSFVYFAITSHRVPNMQPVVILMIFIFVYCLIWGNSKKTLLNQSLISITPTNGILPIQLYLPSFSDFPIKNQCSYIGVAELIIPGMLIAYGRNYDQEYNTKYMHLLSFLYFLSLFLSVSVFAVYSIPQTYFFYTSPILISGILAYALYRQELLSLWRGKLRPHLASSEVSMKTFN